jgi:hypothetical protein
MSERHAVRECGQCYIGFYTWEEWRSHEQRLHPGTWKAICDNLGRAPISDDDEIELTLELEQRQEEEAECGALLIPTRGWRCTLPKNHEHNCEG